MFVSHIYIVNSNIIRNHFLKEKLKSKKEGRIYCTLKKRHLDQIFQDVKILRGNECFKAREYYGVNENYEINTTQNSNFGEIKFILDKEKDKRVKSFLLNNN